MDKVIIYGKSGNQYDLCGILSLSVDVDFVHVDTNIKGFGSAPYVVYNKDKEHPRPLEYGKMISIDMEQIKLIIAV